MFRGEKVSDPEGGDKKMVERNEGKEEIFTYNFSFICPYGREEEVIELFNEKPLGTLSSEVQHSVRHFIDPDTFEVTELTGYEVSGITDIFRKKEVITELAALRIAGYSRPTQIMFHPTKDLNN